MAQTRGGQRRDDTEGRGEERKRGASVRENAFNNMYFQKSSLAKKNRMKYKTVRI